MSELLGILIALVLFALWVAVIVGIYHDATTNRDCTQLVGALWAGAVAIFGLLGLLVYGVFILLQSDD